MTAYTIATGILEDQGLRRFLDLYGIDGGGDPLRAFASGRFPAKKDPTKMMGAAGMQRAMLIAGAGTSLRIYAGFDLSRAEKAGFATSNALRVTGRGSEMSFAFADLVIELMRAPRPLVIFTTASSYERALGRVAVSMDDTSLRIGGEDIMEIDFDRVAYIHGLFKDLPGFKPFELKSLKQRLDLHAIGVIPDPLEKGGAGYAKAIRSLGYRGRLSEAEARAAASDVVALRESLDGLPPFNDPAWILAIKIFDHMKERENA